MTENSARPSGREHDGTVEPGPSPADQTKDRFARLRTIATGFRAPATDRSLWQLANSFLPYLALWAAMYASLEISYWLVVALALPAAGLMVRIFIIQHDCGHDSFLPSRAANSAVGRLCSLVTFTPFANWRRQHNLHHANWNNLDRRQSGADIYSSCLTVEEYRALSRWGRLRYRLVQHPLVALILLPPAIFLVLYRIPFDTPPSWRRERRSVWLTNASLFALYGGLCLALGVEEVLLVQLPINLMASILGVWLFSLQHRFQQSVWLHDPEWDPAIASLQGSSFLKLPKVLQWFTGSIGFHHIHHLDSRIPNYRLEACHNADPQMQGVPTLSILGGIRAWRYALWDEAAGCLVPFRAATASR